MQLRDEARDVDRDVENGSFQFVIIPIFLLL